MTMAPRNKAQHQSALRFFGRHLETLLMQYKHFKRHTLYYENPMHTLKNLHTGDTQCVQRVARIQKSKNKSLRKKEEKNQVSGVMCRVSPVTC